MNNHEYVLSELNMNYANTIKCSSLPWKFYIIFKTWIFFFPTGFFFVLIYDKQVLIYYLTRKNVIIIKISTFPCKFSNQAMINHVKVYIILWLQSLKAGDVI